MGRVLSGANVRTRTAGLLITSELLYHLSYIGLAHKILDNAGIFKPLFVRNSK